MFSTTFTIVSYWDLGASTWHRSFCTLSPLLVFAIFKKLGIFHQVGQTQGCLCTACTLGYVYLVDPCLYRSDAWSLMPLCCPLGLLFLAAGRIFSCHFPKSASGASHGGAWISMTFRFLLFLIMPETLLNSSFLRYFQRFLGSFFFFIDKQQHANKEKFCMHCVSKKHLKLIMHLC